MSVSPTRRKALVLALSMGAAAVLATAAKPRRLPANAQAPAVQLEALFPQSVGAWQVDAARDVFVRPADQQGKLYGIYDQVLERIYVGPDDERVMLSVAYGTEQSAGLQVHRPEICYAGGGFAVSDLHRTALRLADRDVDVTRLHAARPGRSEPITYWTVLGGQVVRDSGSFRLRQLSFGLRGHWLDGMLVRISSIDADPQHAYRVHERFAQALAGALDPARLAQVIGAAASANAPEG